MKCILFLYLVFSVSPLFASADGDLVELARMSNGTYESEKPYLDAIVAIKRKTGRKLLKHIKALVPLYDYKRRMVEGKLRKQSMSEKDIKKLIDSQWPRNKVNPDTLIGFYLGSEQVKFDGRSLRAYCEPGWDSTVDEWRMVWPCERGVFDPKTIAQALNHGIHLVAAATIDSQRVHGLDVSPELMMRHDLAHSCGKSSLVRQVLAEVIKITENDGDEDAIRKAEAFMLLAVHEQNYLPGQGTSSQVLEGVLNNNFEVHIPNHSDERIQEVAEFAKQYWLEHFELLNEDEVVTVNLGDPLPGRFNKSLELRSGEYRHLLSDDDIKSNEIFLNLRGDLWYLWGGAEDQYCHVLNHAGYECETDEYFAAFAWLNSGIVELTNWMRQYIPRLS